MIMEEFIHASLTVVDFCGLLGYSGIMVGSPFTVPRISYRLQWPNILVGWRSFLDITPIFG